MDGNNKIPQLLYTSLCLLLAFSKTVLKTVSIPAISNAVEQLDKKKSHPDNRRVLLPHWVTTSLACRCTVPTTDNLRQQPFEIPSFSPPKKRSETTRASQHAFIPISRLKRQSYLYYSTWEKKSSTYICRKQYRLTNSQGILFLIKLYQRIQRI